jgi:ribosomal protein L7/L12
MTIRLAVFDALRCKIRACLGGHLPHRYAFSVGQMAEKAERDRLLTELAQAAWAAGADADRIARELLRQSDSPIAVIKAIRAVTGMGLGEAKWAVHRNLDPKVRESAEELWRDLLDGLAQLQESDSVPDPDR